jgi:hypothetical protein
MGRARYIVKSAWKMIVGAPWDHDLLDLSRVPVVSLQPLGPWYYDLGRSIVRGDYQWFDAEGIPREKMGWEIIYHPSRVASFGLAYVTRHILQGDPEDLRKAIKAARWLVANQVGHGRLEGAFPLPFNWGCVAAPWPSSLTQGTALSLLVRVYALTTDGAFLRAAQSALIPLERPLEDGGLRHPFHNTAHTWLEEYPDVSDPSHVLNGFVYALWGLRDAGLIGVAGAEDLYRDGVRSLAATLDPFDRGYWSNYQCPEHSPPRVASLTYHRLHIAMMRIMSQLEPDEVFARLADRLEGYAAKLGFRVKALAGKLGDAGQQRGRKG